MEHRSFRHLQTVVHTDLCMPDIVKVQCGCINSMQTEMVFEVVSENSILRIRTWF